ncbi:MAG: VOC family protein [Actinobacteria bacterium]|nr:VOC family protein [Actinomycetota bacterium]
MYFEIPVRDLGRACDFYSKVFETTLTRDVVDGYQMAMFDSSEDSFGASGALVVGDVYVPSLQGCFLYFGVDNIDDVLARVLSHGGKVLYPKKSNGELGSVAEFQDTEGNRIALHEEKN